MVTKDRPYYIKEFENCLKNGNDKILWKEASFYDREFINNLDDGNVVYITRNKKYYIDKWK